MCMGQERLALKIRYSLAGQDTRLSPERLGFESRWRKCFAARKLADGLVQGWQSVGQRADPGSTTGMEQGADRPAAGLWPQAAG